MSDTLDDARRKLDAAHLRLKQDLHDLEVQVEQTMDWRWQFRRRPWLILGAAFGSALLFGFLVGHPAPDRSNGITER